MFRLLLQVHIKGKPLGHLGILQVEFNWPREVSNGKWLLYLTEIQMNGTSEPLCSPPGNIINPLNLKVTMTTSASQNKSPGLIHFRIHRTQSNQLKHL